MKIFILISTILETSRPNMLLKYPLLYNKAGYLKFECSSSVQIIHTGQIYRHFPTRVIGYLYSITVLEVKQYSSRSRIYTTFDY